MPSVRVEPDGNSIQIARGDLLLGAVARAGVIVEAPCGGRGNCGKCLVRVVSGEAPASERCAEAGSVLRPSITAAMSPAAMGLVLSR